MQISIIVADDHLLFRDALVALLQREPDFSIIGEASDGKTALMLARELHPNILVLDVEMPGINGIEIAGQASAYCPKTHIIMVSMYSNEHYVNEALQNGARAYILKTETGNTLVQAIRGVLAGKRYLSPRIMSAICSAHTDSHLIKESLSAVFPKLSSREFEVLILIASGNTNTQVANKLRLSPRTVEKHRANLMCKLGLRSAADLVAFAVRSGLVD